MGGHWVQEAVAGPAGLGFLGVGFAGQQASRIYYTNPPMHQAPGRPGPHHGRL